MNCRAFFASFGLLAAPLAAAADLYTPFEALPAETFIAFRVDNSAETRERYQRETEAGRMLLSDERIARFKAALRRALNETEQGKSFEESLHEIGLGLEDLYAMLSSSLGGAVVAQAVPGAPDMPTVLLWADMEDGVAEKLIAAIRSAAENKEAIEREDLEFAGADGSRIRNNVTGDSFLVAELGGRAFFAIGFPMESMADPEQSLKFEEAEASTLGHFIHAQSAGDGGFLSRFYGDPGVASVRPDFEPQVEALGDLRKLMEFAPPENQAMIEAFELAQLDKLAIWSGLSEGQAKSLVFLGAPAPRSGIVKLMEQQPFSLRPPAWVPSTVRGYAAFSIDARQVFQTFVDIAKKLTAPDVVEMQLDQANQQLRETLQTDLDAIISSIGGRVHVLTFPTRLSEMPLGEGAVAAPQSPQAIVADFADTEILQSAFNMAAAMGSEAIQTFEEQGFTGVRAPQPDGEVAFAFGLGKLVFAKGDGLASQVFSTLSNPPVGEGALLNDPEFRRFLESADPSPAAGFTYENGAKAWENLDATIDFLVSVIKSSVSEDASAIVDEFRQIVPEEDELKELIGFVFARVYTTDAGLVVEGASEYR